MADNIPTTTLMNELIDALNAHDLDRIGACYAVNFAGEDVGRAGPESGREMVRQSYARLLRAFPDAHFDAETLIHGDRAALIWTMSGTHQGTFLNVPATGRKIAFRGVSVLTIAGGEIISGHRIWDIAGFLRSVRLLPELPDER